MNFGNSLSWIPLLVRLQTRDRLERMVNYQVWEQIRISVREPVRNQVLDRPSGIGGQFWDEWNEL